MVDHDGLLEMDALVLRCVLSIFGLVGLLICTMGVGILHVGNFPAMQGLINTLIVIPCYKNTQVIMLVIGPMIALGAVGLWTKDMSEDIGWQVLVPIGHLLLSGIPCGAVYLHKKTGETMLPPALVSALGVIHLCLWLKINDGDEVAVVMAVAVLAVLAVWAVVIFVAVLLAKPNEPLAPTAGEIEPLAPTE